MDGTLGKLVAVTVGVGLCLIALTAWRLPTSGSPPGLDLRLIAVPPGELTVEPTGVIASERGMQAGDPAAGGHLRVVNIGGRPLRVRLIALPSDRGLGGRVRLRAASAGRTLVAGRLSSLADPKGPGLRLPARGSGRIEVSAWMPAGASGYRGGILDVTLELRARPLEAK
jgi:hypothetical protein